WIYRDVPKCFFQLLALGRFCPYRLSIDGGDVISQRHRRRPMISTSTMQKLRVFAPLITQRIVKIIERRTTLVSKELPRTKFLKSIFQDAIREAQLLGQTTAAFRADRGQVLQNERIDEPFIQTGFFEVSRLRRPKRFLGEEYGERAQCWRCVHGSHSKLLM